MPTTLENRDLPVEIVGVLRLIDEDVSLREKVQAMHGNAFVIRFACNGGTVHRNLVQQQPGGVVITREKTAKLPRELVQLKERLTRDEELIARVRAFSGGKFDLVAPCQGYSQHADVLVQEVS